MTTYDIPADRWIEFFDDFSRAHAGWPTTIEVLDFDTGPQNIAENLPLEGISFDQKGTRASSLEIAAGNTVTGPHVNHVIDLPLHVREVIESDDRLDLQIEPARGPTTLIHLRAESA